MKIKPDQTWTMDVPDAGKLFYGLGKNASYEAARRGDIPTIKIGGRYRAVVSAIKERLEQAGK